MNKLLSDKEDGIIFECFGIWHWLYLAFLIALTALSIYYLKNKDETTRRNYTNIIINLAFFLYVADFFLMPFAIEKIDVDKLPFHSCTSMCVMCFAANHNRFLSKFRTNFALLGMLSNLMFVVYPSGPASYETHPFSYRALQTLLFHGLMAVFGILVIVYEKNSLEFKHWRADLGILIALTGWALLGNWLYTGEAGEYSEDLNWFFIRQDPFDLIPEGIAPYITPFVNLIAFMALELIARFIYVKIMASVNEKKKQQSEPTEREAAHVS